MMEKCPDCGTPETAFTYKQYDWTEPEHYDGVSEIWCPCGNRWGRWTGNLLADGEVEPRYGRGKVSA
jgi:hypothetical protein